MKNSLLYLALVIALLATLGSLYFSEIAGFAPCLLCWYQRILMYPLVIIIAVGILLKDKRVSLYSLPFSILGILVAFYHVLVERGIIPEAASPCKLGVSCATKYINWFGVVTIPTLSLAAFVLITVSLILYWKYEQRS